MIASAIAIPLGLWIGHTGRFRGLAVALTGALRALPTLGVLTYASSCSPASASTPAI